MVSMLLLELAGAPDEVIVADYAATERYMQPVFAKLVEQMKGIGVDVPDHALRSGAGQHAEASGAPARKIRQCAALSGGWRNRASGAFGADCPICGVLILE